MITESNVTYKINEKSEKRKRGEATILKSATVLASKVAAELAECTSVDWTITPDVCCLDWALSFRCPGATVDCITVKSTMFSGLWDCLTDEYDLNWMVYRIKDSVLSFCLQKCIHGCCRKDPDSIWYPAEVISENLKRTDPT